MENNNIYKVILKKNIRKSICSCGLSNKIPYCDNTHRIFNEKNNCTYKSIKITSDKDVEVVIASSKWKINEN